MQQACEAGRLSEVEELLFHDLRHHQAQHETAARQSPRLFAGSAMAEVMVGRVHDIELRTHIAIRFAVSAMATGCSFVDTFVRYHVALDENTFAESVAVATRLWEAVPSVTLRDRLGAALWSAQAALHSSQSATLLSACTLFEWPRVGSFASLSRGKRRHGSAHPTPDLRL